MIQAPLVKVRASTAAEICATFNLNTEARQFLRDGIAPREFAGLLLANKQYIAGIDFMAHALPVREGVWWGCLCLQHVYGEALAGADKAACKAAAQWVLQSSEENRLATRATAEAAGPASPAGSLAAAVFQSGGNVAPPKAPPVAPAPFAAAKALATAVKLASTRSEPARIADTQRSFVELGIGVAEGRYL